MSLPCLSLAVDVGLRIKMLYKDGSIYFSTCLRFRRVEVEKFLFQPKHYQRVGLKALVAPCLLQMSATHIAGKFRRTKIRDVSPFNLGWRRREWGDAAAFDSIAVSSPTPTKKP